MLLQRLDASSAFAQAAYTFYMSTKVSSRVAEPSTERRSVVNDDLIERGACDLGSGSPASLTIPTHARIWCRALLQQWWAGARSTAVDAIMLGLQHELPHWGRSLRDRYVARERGNFPDQPCLGEPRALDDIDDKAEPQ